MDDHWFLNSRVSVALAQADNADGISILRHELPFDDAPPFHVHYREDETFVLLAGRIRFKLAEAVIERKAGDTVFLPRGIPHGFRVVSSEGALILTITRGGFESMVRAAWRPAMAPGLPEMVEPTPEMQTSLAELCAANGIELLGAPIV